MMSIQNVKLVPTSSAQKPWQVSVNGGLPGDHPGNYPKVDVPQGSGAHLIVFEIGGSPNSGITFAATNPISVKAGSKPAVGSGSTDPQIAALPSLDGKQLFVLDTNQTAGQLHYALAFTGHPNLDPIIDNGGHGFMWGTAELLIGAAVFLAVGFFLRPLFRAIFGR